MARHHRAAFTLLELLVVVAILTVLIAVLLPALSAARIGAKRLVCGANMRTIAREFESFADGTSVSGRGDSESLGLDRFRINDFQDMLYRIDEFWDQGEATTAVLSADREGMLCPAGPARLVRKKGYPCGQEALGPVGDISVALNMRLHRAVVDFRGKQVLSPVASTFVSSRILNHPYVPLAMDVDGAAMASQGLDPFYMAPGKPGAEDPYGMGRYWVRPARHGRRTNVAFVGGHVLSSERPEEEHWNWNYQAETH